MKVHLIKKQTILTFIEGKSNAKRPFENWITIVRFAVWEKPIDIKKTFGTADLLGNGSNRVVFNIGGNNYRMICKYHFGLNQVHLIVCWIGTHNEYDELCIHGNQYNVNDY